MSGVITLLVSLVVFSAVVLVHEGGHYFAARHCGIRVEEFSVGFGPAIWSKVKNGTRYSVRILPFGGYNMLSGAAKTEDDEDGGEEKNELRCYDKNVPLFPCVADGKDFTEAPPWDRFEVMIAGALMNFVLGFVLLLVLVCSTPTTGSTTVAKFTDGSKSAETGLQLGDEILSVDGTFCHTSRDLAAAFDGTEQTHTIRVRRGDETLVLENVVVAPCYDEDGQMTSYVDFRVSAESRNLRNALWETGWMFRYYSGAILGSFTELVQGKADVSELSGPVGVVSAVGTAVSYGWQEVLSLAALLTINLGIFNLLPIPALDGFKLLFLAFEGITGYAVPLKIQNAFNVAGSLMLVGLMLFVSFQDILRLL